jgi:hypothetical protein
MRDAMRFFIGDGKAQLANAAKARIKVADDFSLPSGDLTILCVDAPRWL